MSSANLVLKIPLYLSESQEYVSVMTVLKIHMALPIVYTVHFCVHRAHLSYFGFL